MRRPRLSKLLQRALSKSRGARYELTTLPLDPREKTAALADLVAVASVVGEEAVEEEALAIEAGVVAAVLEATVGEVAGVDVVEAVAAMLDGAAVVEVREQEASPPAVARRRPSK